MDWRVLKMEFFVKVEVEIPSYALVFGVESIADTREPLSEVLELRIVVWFDDKVVILELVKVKGVLDHLCVLRQRSSKGLRKA